jgi:HSP20 family protein
MAKAEENRNEQQQGAGTREGSLERREQYPSLFSGSPFSFMRRFSEEMDRLFEDFGFGERGRAGGLPTLFGGERGMRSSWMPQIEVAEREGKLVVSADLPGMKKEDVKVSINDDVLTIQGERRAERKREEQGYFSSERSYGSFFRTLRLPQGVNAENATCTFRDGVLEITMDAPQRSRGRLLDIKG